MSQSLFNHRFPGHQAESHAIVQHGEAATCKHQTAAVDATDPLTIGGLSILQAGFRCDALRSPGQLPIAQRRQ